MATLIQAVTKYRPHVVHDRTIGLETIAQRLGHRSLAAPSVRRMVLHEVQEQIFLALKRGEAVQLPGIARFEVTVGMDGTLRLKSKPDRGLKRRISELRDFEGEIANREHIGLSSEQPAAMWNAEHPDDPIRAPKTRKAA